MKLFNFNLFNRESDPPAPELKNCSSRMSGGTMVRLTAMINRSFGKLFAEIDHYKTDDCTLVDYAFVVDENGNGTSAALCPKPAAGLYRGTIVKQTTVRFCTSEYPSVRFVLDRKIKGEDDLIPCIVLHDPASAPRNMVLVFKDKDGNYI